MHSTYRGWRNLHMMRPSDILFTQRSISNTFGRPDRNKGRLIGETLDDLRESRITVWDICPIRVFQHNGRWWSMDNRRLWVFRQFQKAGGCDDIPVQIKTREEMDDRKFSTRTGEDVYINCGLMFFTYTGSEWYDKQARQREREEWERLASLGDRTDQEHRANPERDPGVTPLIGKNVSPKHAKDEASEQKRKTDAVSSLWCGRILLGLVVVCVLVGIVRFGYLVFAVACVLLWIVYCMFTANK